jgi:hypothetical protein
VTDHPTAPEATAREEVGPERTGTEELIEVELEAEAEGGRFGHPGPPLSRRNPFMFGLLLGLGLIVSCVPSPGAPPCWL